MFDHKLLSVLFEFVFDLFNDTNQEALATFVGISILSTEYLKNLSPEESPLGGVVWELEVVKHLLEKLVADLVGSLSFLNVVLNDDLVLDETQTLILDDVEEKVILHIFELLLGSLDSVAWMEEVEFLQTFVSWLSSYQTEVMNVLFEASPDVWLGLHLNGCVDTHILYDFESLLAVIFHVLFGHVGGSFLLRLVWLVQLLVLLDVLNELDWVQHALARKFVEFSLASAEDELLFLNRQLLSSVGHDT